MKISTGVYSLMVQAGINQDIAAEALRDLKKEWREEHAEIVRAYADNPRVKPYLLDGEWTGIRMGANALHPERETGPVAPARGCIAHGGPDCIC